MTDSSPEHRAYHQPDPSHVSLRENLDDGDGVFTVRMPLATTGEVRNQGDEPLTRDEIDGMARQIEERSIGVFLDHGSNPDIAGSRYSAVGKVGEWRNPEVATRDAGADELVADARLMDPETLPAATGGVREALAALKEQVKRGIPLSSSIGWREAEDYPGGNDLMEASIVGIPADPRTVSESSGTAAVVARAAVAAGANPDELLEEVRAVVMEPDSEQDMTEDTEDASDGSTDPDAEQNEESEETREAPEWADRMLELQKQQTETLNSLVDSLQESDSDDEDEDDDDEDDEDDDDGEQSASPEDEQSTVPDGIRDLMDADDPTVEDVAEYVRGLQDDLEDARENRDISTPDDGDDEDSSEQRDTTDDDHLAKYEIQ